MTYSHLSAQAVVSHSLHELRFYLLIEELDILEQLEGHVGPESLQLCVRLVEVDHSVFWSASSRPTNPAGAPTYSLKYALRRTMLHNRVEFVMLRYACDNGQHKLRRDDSV